jgi:hypothetical protein
MATALVVVTVNVEEPEPVTELGAKDPLALAGNPLTLKETLPVNPLLGVIVAV